MSYLPDRAAQMDPSQVPCHRSQSLAVVNLAGIHHLSIPAPIKSPRTSLLGELRLATCTWPWLALVFIVIIVINNYCCFYYQSLLLLL